VAHRREGGGDRRVDGAAMMRSLAAVAAGYLTFSVSSALFFGTTGQDPHQLPGLGFLASSIVYGAGFSALGGYIAARIAGQHARHHAALVAALIAVTALAALIIEWNAGSIWSQLAVLLVMAPAALAGGYLWRGRAGREG